MIRRRFRLTQADRAKYLLDLALCKRLAVGELLTHRFGALAAARQGARTILIESKGYCGGIATEGGTADTAAVEAALAERLRAYGAHMEAIEVRKSAQELRAIWVAGNEYLQEAAPWSAFKEDPEKAALVGLVEQRDQPF